MTIPILYTPEEVAEKLKVTRRSVYEWLLKGRLRGLRAGDNWRISEQDLMAFLESRADAKPAIGPTHPDYSKWRRYFSEVDRINAAKAARGGKKEGPGHER